MKKNSSHGGTKTQRGDFDSLVDDMMELAGSLNQLHKQMVDECAPIVQNMIRNRCRDQQQIEHTLDRLLDCACIPEGLTLFKSLCRYYYTLNPAATANYIGYYREMWDSEEDGEAGNAGLRTRFSIPASTEPRGPGNSSEPRGWHSRGSIPHFDSNDVIQHVTFHLADSLPKETVERLVAELQNLDPDISTTIL